MSIAGLSHGVWEQALVTAPAVAAAMSATAFTKTAFVELTAGLTRAAVGMEMVAWLQSAPSVDSMLFFDIAFGAASSEVVVVRDFPIAMRNYESDPPAWYIPIAIPATTRVSYRVSSSVASGGTINAYTQFQLSSPLTAQGAAICTALGLADPVTSLSTGSTVTVSTTNGVFGTAVQFSASTPHAARWVRIVPMTIANPSYRPVFVRLSLDSAGANVVGPITYLPSSAMADFRGIGITLPCWIPQGSDLHLSVATAQGGQTTAHRFAVHLFG